MATTPKRWDKADKCKVRRCCDGSVTGCGYVCECGLFYPALAEAAECAGQNHRRTGKRAKFDKAGDGEA